MNKPTLGVVMIVKNEEKNLGGVLSDIRDVVDEICVVDTGSNDGTVSIAESFGARIEHFPWCNDFSAARNHSIACAQSDYLLWLDADDRIDEDDRKSLLKLKAGLLPQKDKAYMLKILSRSKDMPDTVSYQTRIIPNRKGIAFEGKIHEQILPSLKRCAVTVDSLDITIRHTGYNDAESRTEKGKRNLAILQEELREGKETATQCFFIAMACISIQEYEKCLEYITLARQKRTDEDWLHFSYTISTECLLRINRVQDARQEILKGIAAFPKSMLLHYYLGTVCQKAKDHSGAVAAFEKASGLPLHIDSYPVPPDLRTIILVQYGKSLEELGRQDDAMRVYDQELKSGGDRKVLHTALGMALLQKGRIEESLLHLEKAKEASNSVDISLWLSLAQVHLYRKNHDKAHALFIDILTDAPSNLHALAGVLDTSIDMDDIDTFFRFLEQCLLILNVPIPETEINSLADCADLCVRIAHRLEENDEPVMARRLAEIALRLDAACANAHLFLADVFAEQGDTARMVASLETALKNGADGNEVLRRIERAKKTDGANP